MIDTVVCPACRRALRVPDTLHGQLVKCPACEQTFTATDDLEPAPRRYGEEPVSREEELKLEPEDPVPAHGHGPRWRRGNVLRPRRGSRREDDEGAGRAYHPRPGKAQAIAILTLVGGIFASLLGFVLVLTCFGLLWPGTYYTLVTGSLCIIKGAQLLSSDGRYEAPPMVTAILQIVNVINLDLLNVTLGILNLVFLNDPEVRRYYRG